MDHVDWGKVPWFDFVPAIFVGAGVFFGFMSYVPGASYSIAAFTEFTYCLIGLIYGVVTVALRVAYEGYVKKRDDQVENDSVEKSA